MTSNEWWTRAVDVAAILWIALFAIDVAASRELLALTAAEESVVRSGLWVLLAVFLLDIALLYRWSEQRPRAFVRSNWLLIIAAIPWFRPLRLLRVGRGVLALRVLAGTRRVGAAFNKVRRMGRRYWRRRRE